METRLSIAILCIVTAMKIVATTANCPSFCSCERKSSESSKVISVECNQSSLRYIPDKFPKSSQYISLERNMIRTLSGAQFNGLENLVKINISLNNITTISQRAFLNLDRLELIDLQNNQLRFLRNRMIENCTNVRTININKNLIHTFSNEFCPKCTNLENLYLRDNELSILQNDAFVQFRRLKLIDLRENRFTKLSFKNVWFPSSINELHLGSNGISTAADLKLQNAKNLQILGVEMNSIEDADKLVMDNLTRLQFVNFSCNSLTRVPHTNFPIHSLHTLDFSRNHIRTLQRVNFTNFYGLRVIYLDDNKLLKLPKCLFHGNSDLTEVHLERNQLKEISADTFCQTNRLSKLYLQNNNISQVELSNIPSLQLVNLNDNEITDSQLEYINNLPSVNTFLLSGNNLSNLTRDILRNLNALQELDLSNNQLLYIDNNSFSNVALTLKYLDIRQNKIEMLSNSFDKLNYLERLDMSLNRITSLPKHIFNGLGKLLILNISYNSIDNVEKEAFGHLDSVIDLDISHNVIIGLPSRIFSKMKNLISLDLSGNYINDLTEDAFSGLKNLKFLNLKENNILSINNQQFTSMYNLIELNLCYNKLTRITMDTFRGLLSLIKLDLSQNNIHIIEPNSFQHFVYIESISLSFNKIANFQNISFNCQGNVKDLKLDHNLIDNTTFHVDCIWRNIQTIDLSFNKIKTVMPETFEMFPKLNYLNLSENLLETIPNIKAGNKINRLYIGNNHIKYVGNYEFENLTELIELDLSGMCLQEIETFAFSGLRRLELLNLEETCSSNLKREIFTDLLNIRYMGLSRNPWSCDCFLKDFLAIFLEKDKLTRLEKPDIICQSPSDVYLQSAFDVSENEMVCKPPVVEFLSDGMVSQSGEKITLMCMAHGIPKPKISWHRSSSSITESIKTKTIQTSDGVLLVSEITHAQIGDYVCTATNAVGKDNKSIEIQPIDDSNKIVFAIIVTAIISSMLTLFIIACWYLCVKHKSKVTSKYRLRNSKPELRCYENKGRDIQEDYVTIGQHYQKSCLTHDVKLEGKWKDVHKRYLSREDMIEFGQYMTERTMGYGVIRRFNSDHLYLNGHEESAWNEHGLITAVSDSHIDDELRYYTSNPIIAGEYSGPTTPIPLTPLEVAYKYGYKDKINQDNDVAQLEMHLTQESMLDDFERTFTEKIKEYGGFDKIIRPKLDKSQNIKDEDDDKKSVSASTASTSTSPIFNKADDKLKEPTEIEQTGREDPETIHHYEHSSGADRDLVTEDTVNSPMTLKDVSNFVSSVVLHSNNTEIMSQSNLTYDDSIKPSTKHTKGYLNEHYRAMSDDSNSDITSLWDIISLDIDRLDIIEVEFEESVANLDSQCEIDEISL